MQVSKRKNKALKKLEKITVKGKKRRNFKLKKTKDFRITSKKVLFVTL